MGRTALLLIRFYQYALSPYWPGACRFQPSCSHYAYEAVERYGFFRGGWMAARRLARCWPWAAMGYDPVPVRDAHEAARHARLNRRAERSRKTIA